MTPAVAVVTLGCGRNDADSAQVEGALQAAGYRLVEDAAEADCVLVNTCTFIEPARQESVDTILGVTDLRRPDGQTPQVVVIGCMAQRYGQELAEAVPEAAAVVGFADYGRLSEIVGDALGRRPSVADDTLVPPNGRTLPVVSLELSQPPGPAAPPTAAFPVRTVPRGPWAYLKIAGGCDRVCTFCTIPSYRGRFASRPAAELQAEARWLAEQGVRELVCVSENTTSWGKDLPGGRRSQVELIRAFERVEGLEWIRLMYLQPAEIVPQLLDAMAASRVVAPYYDLSLQHASGAVLSRMARSGDAERFLGLIEGIRARDPRAVFRSSFILGFPGETQEDVDVLAEFLQEARLDWAGFFVFSPEDGTPAAAMPDQVPADEAAARRDAIVDVQELVADDQAGRWVGREARLLVEEVDGDDVVGRTARESPETDGEVRVVGATQLGWQVGDVQAVRIVDAVGVDLVAEPLSAPAAGSLAAAG